MLIFRKHSMKCSEKSVKDTETVLPVGNEKMPDKSTIMKNLAIALLIVIIEFIAYHCLK